MSWKNWTAELLIVATCAGAARAASDPCARLSAAWKEVRSYQCTYRAVTLYDGKTKETLMKYSYAKPGKIRMDIEKPRKGAVLIYNPEVSPKVRVRPFPKASFAVLSYPLNHPRVTSGDGGTVDKSDLGHRGEAFCAQWKAAAESDRKTRGPSEFELVLHGKDGTVRKRFHLDGRGLIDRIEVLDGRGRTTETFEWTDLRVNPDLPPDLFRKF